MAWKKISDKARSFDDKQVITTRTIMTEKVQRRVEPLGRFDVKAEKKDNIAKIFWIIISVIVAVVLASVFL